MNLDTAKTVREVALNNPAATRVFEKFGIDYCCGGNKSLEQACGEANLKIQQVLESLNLALSASDSREEGKAWLAEPLADLIMHINNTHHKYTREEIARLRPLFDKVCNVHGEKHPELQQVRHDFHALAQELSTHMMKEEAVLFPYIERMEEAAISMPLVGAAPGGDSDLAAGGFAEFGRIVGGQDLHFRDCVRVQRHVRGAIVPGVHVG